ncbi:F-box/kelch-repeat protein At3g23880-like [Salvia miltiorrhiza]|uniref:F-box/kelch-repeat protein At3g23880-like n=1 Tax=Salvia miltiorrhiza TaxID=226208 RepID=UPI0025AC253D|nr:F-box/kelch-repeat protein At3g23880-like [Salvia miltiorrhiza]XP_057792327.1 F-box/kelch-repeat protein At3g23880-like [Salvia miltiorrhiza]
MADYFFEEIIINILHRLPVKTLLRCTAVCKSWHSLITSREFTSSHLKFAQKVAPSLLLRRCIKSSERYELYSDDESFARFAAFQFPFRSMNSFFTIVGSCNGLLCLSDDRVYFMNTIVLWNPSVKKSVLLPKPNMIYNSHGSFLQYLGFGFDPVGSDYKVVRITYVDLATHPQIEVYKLSSGVWHDMSCLELDSVLCSRARPVYVNGASHWLARYLDLHDVIVSFDMSLEVFSTMMLPALRVSDDELRSRDLAVYMDCLALTLWSVSGAEQCFCVWVMNQYGVEKSWTKTFCFDFSSFGNEFVRPLWIRKQGEVVVVCQDGRLVSCDRGGGVVRDVGVRGHRSDTYQRSLDVDTFVCSLVLMERGRCSSDVATGNSLHSLQTDDGDNVGSSGSEHEKGSGKC